MGGRGYGSGERGRVYTYRDTVTTRMTCIKMGSDESNFNVSLIVRDKVTRQCPQCPLLLTSLTPYRWAKPANSALGFHAEVTHGVAETGVTDRD